MRYMLIMLFTLIVAPAFSAPHCTVVYDGDAGVLEHEIAHCHGWEHDGHDPNATQHRHPRAPAKYRKPYSNVTIHKTSPKRWYQPRTEAAALCEQLTGESYDTPYLRTVRGCAIGGLLK